MAWLQLLVLTAFATPRGNDAVQLLAPGYALGYATRYADNYAQRTTHPPDTHIPAEPQKYQLLPARPTPEQNKDDKVPNIHSKSDPWVNKTENDENRSSTPPHPSSVPYNAESDFSTTSRPHTVASGFPKNHVTHQQRTSEPTEDENTTGTSLNQPENIHPYLEPPLRTTSRVSPIVEVDQKGPVNSKHDSNRGKIHDQDVPKTRPTQWSRRTAATVNEVPNTRTVPRQRSSTPKDFQMTSRHSLRIRQRTEDPQITPRSGWDSHTPRRERVPTTADSIRRHTAAQRLMGRPIASSPPVPPTLPPRVPPRRHSVGRPTTRRAERVTLTLPMEGPAPTREPTRSGRTQTVHAEAMQNDDVGNPGVEMKFQEVTRPTFQEQKEKRNESDNREVRDGENVREATEEIVVPKESKGIYTNLFSVVGDSNRPTLILETSTNDPRYTFDANNGPHSSEIENKQVPESVSYRNEQHNADSRTEGTTAYNTEEVADSKEQSGGFPLYPRGRDNFPRQEHKPPHEHAHESHLTHRNNDSLEQRSQTAMTKNSKDLIDHNTKESRETDVKDSNRGQDHSNKNDHDNLQRYTSSEKSKHPDEKLNDSSNKQSEDNHNKPPQRPIDISPITFTYTENRNSPQPYQYNYLLQRMNETQQSNSRNKLPNQLYGSSLNSPQNHSANHSILRQYGDQHHRSDNTQDQSQNQSDQMQRLPQSYPVTQSYNQKYVDFQNPQNDHSLQKSNQQENYSPQSQTRRNDQGEEYNNSQDRPHNFQNRLISRPQPSQNQQLDQPLTVQGLIIEKEYPQNLPNNTQRIFFDESHNQDLSTEKSKHNHLPPSVTNHFEQNRPIDRHQEQPQDSQQYRVKDDRNDHPYDPQVHQHHEQPQERLAIISYNGHKPIIDEYSINYPNQQPGERANNPLDHSNEKMRNPSRKELDDRVYHYSEQPKVTSEQENDAQLQNGGVAYELSPNLPPTRPSHSYTTSDISNRRNNPRRDRGRPSNRNYESQDNAASDAPDSARACTGRRNRLARGCAGRNKIVETQPDPQQGKTRRREAYGNQRASLSRQLQEWDESLEDSNEGVGRSAGNGRGSGVVHRLQPGSPDDNSLLQAEEEAWALDEWGGEAWDWGAASASGFFDYLPAWESFRTSPRARPADANALVPEEDYGVTPPPPPPSPPSPDAGGWRRRNRPTRLPAQSSPPPSYLEEDVQATRKPGGRYRLRGLNERKPHTHRVSTPDVSKEQEDEGGNKDATTATEAQDVQTIEQKSASISTLSDSKTERPLRDDDRLKVRLYPEVNKKLDIDDVQNVTSTDIPPQQNEEKEISGGEKHRLGYLFPLSERLDKQKRPFDMYIPRVKLNFDSYPLHDPSVYKPKYLQNFSLTEEKKNDTRESGESNVSKEHSPTSLDGDAVLERDREREREQRNYEWSRERQQELDRESDRNRNIDRDRDRERSREEEEEKERDRERGQEGVRVSKEKELSVVKEGGKCGGKECDVGDDRTDRFYGNEEQAAASRWRLVSKHRPVLDIHGWNPFADWD